MEIQQRDKTCTMKTTKTLLNEIKEDLNKWKDTPSSWLTRIDTVKMAKLPKLTYKVSKAPELCCPVNCSLTLQSLFSDWLLYLIICCQYIN